MIQNLKNFIRHGKQARERSPENQAHSYPPATSVAQQQAYGRGIVEPAPYPAVVYQPSQQAAAAVGHGRHHHEYNEAAEKIVAEEREARTRLPRYPGLERFRLLDKMGDGAFSTVYKAQYRDTGQFVAIKVVRKHELNASQIHLANMKKKPNGVEVGFPTRGNILKEVSIMRQLNHPNVVSLIEFQESRDYYFLILELCSGGELFHQIVRLTYFSEDLSRHVILQVAKGIRYLHEEKGVVHRDIKPENLLFEPIPFIPSRNPKPRAPEDEEKEDEGEFIPGIGSGGIGKITIADFGLSKIVWDSQTMTPCGTVGYTAPEIVKDERYSKSVDMWALGCVLYTLLCGFPPFYDESIQTLTEKVARGQYTFLSPWWDSISKSAKDLISHLLTVDPVRRYTIDEFLHHPWIRETGEETTPAFDAPPTTLRLDKGEFIEPMDGVEEIGFAGGIPANVRAAMQAGTQPLTPGARAAEFRSPGSVSLREVFDVSYAVHRMEEERARRGKARGFGNLNALDEDDEDTGLSAVPEADESVDAGSSDEDVLPPGKKASGSVWNHVAEDQLSAVQRDMQKAAISKDLQHRHRRRQPVAAVATTSTRKTGSQRTGGAGFQLNMEGATLLSRRGKGPEGSDATPKAASKALEVKS